MDFNRLIDNLRDDLIRNTQEIIKIKSVEQPPLPGMPFGEGVNHALEYALGLARNLGFTIKNLDGYAGYAEYGDGEETLGILVHLDIVPEGDGWTYPPYGGEIHGGRIYGRGTIDNKGPAIAALYALKAVMDSGVPFKRKVRIIFGTNEETNWGCMEYYLQKEPSPELAFVPDADYPLINGEKGVTNITFKVIFPDSEDSPVKLNKVIGGTRPNMVPDYCEAYLQGENLQEVKSTLARFKKETGYSLDEEANDKTILIKSYGTSAHGSLPEKGQNAISQLMSFLSELELGKSAGGKLVSFYNQYIGMKYNGELMGIDLCDKLSGKLTFNLGMINFQDQEGDLVANTRVPISYSVEEVVKKIEEVLKRTAIEVIPGKSMNSYYIPEDDFLVQKLLKVYQEQTKDYSAKPRTIGGATYARTLPKAVPFGPLFPGTPETAHEKDEHITVDDLLKNTNIYAQAIYELTR